MKGVPKLGGNNKMIGIGIVGCGSVMHPYMSEIENLAGRGLVRLTMMCDIDESKREYVKEKFRVPKFTTDYSELINSDAVDLVMVLSPGLTHGKIAIAALKAGKYVLTEKPMSTSLEEAQELVGLSHKSKGYLLCAPFVILSPTYKTIWQRVNNGDIGKVFSARAFYGMSGPSWAEWFYKPGGGCLFDVSAYNLTSLTGILGPAKRVCSMNGIAIPGREVEDKKIKVQAPDNAHILIDFGESVFAVVSAGYVVQQQRCPAIELYGDKGTIQMMGYDWAPDGYEMWQNSMGSWQIFPETYMLWRWTDGVRYLVECIIENKPPIITPEHAYHVLEVMIRAVESAEEGQFKEVKSTFPPPVFHVEIKQEESHLIHDPATGRK